jgi:hypothetical protein
MQELNLYVAVGQTKMLTAEINARIASIPGIPGDIIGEDNNIIANISGNEITGLAEGEKHFPDYNIKIYVTSGLPPNTVALPTVTIPGGAYKITQMVTIDCATENAAIYYTLDDSTPDVNNGTAYNGSAISITPEAYPGKTLKAIAVKSGMEDSAVLEVSYVRSVTVVSPTSQDIMIKFGIKQAGYIPYDKNDVIAAFNALHTYLIDAAEFTTATLSSSTGNAVHVGDYIDLPKLEVSPSPLVSGDELKSGAGAVDSPQKRGAVNASNTVLTAHGTILRVVVVGVNSFNRRDSQPNNYKVTPHIVFQFQNLPALHRMNSVDDNTTGYMESEMRAYLTNNFFAGLKDAGVPEEFFWAPKRLVWQGNGNTDVDEITDTLWLPTEWEIRKLSTYSNSTYETTLTQAHLEYYTANAKRMKYDSGNIAKWYRAASPHHASATAFCGIYIDGSANHNAAGSVGGVAPAFCIR